MLFDEPKASLDPENRDTEVVLIEEAKASGGATADIFHDESVGNRVATLIHEMPRRAADAAKLQTGL